MTELTKNPTKKRQTYRLYDLVNEYLIERGRNQNSSAAQEIEKAILICYGKDLQEWLKSKGEDGEYVSKKLFD